MIIVITPEEIVPNETEIINELFQEGLDLLHIRKPFINSEELANFIQKIDSEFHHQLVLHSHYDLAKDFKISRFHFKEADRQNNLFKSFTDQIISTSVHDIDTAMFLFDTRPQVVFARAGAKFHSYEDFATIMLGFEDQKVAIIASKFWQTGSLFTRLQRAIARGGEPRARAPRIPPVHAPLGLPGP